MEVDRLTPFARSRDGRERRAPQGRAAAGAPAATAQLLPARTTGPPSTTRSWRAYSRPSLRTTRPGPPRSRRPASSTWRTRPAGLPRFRVNGFRQRGAISFAFRVIPSEHPGLRATSACRRASPLLAEEHRGPGPRHGRDRLGQDDHARRDDRAHQRHTATCTSSRSKTRSRSSTPTSGASSTSARSGWTPTRSTKPCAGALRQDPDVILIGELRDAETAQTALQAAESGHLVLSTLHTIDAAETIGRIIEFFPAEKQQLVRSILAGVLRGVDQPAAAPADRQRPRRGRRGDGQQRADRRPDRENTRRRDRGRDRGRRLLQDADLHAGVDRPRRRRRGRPGGGGERRDEPPRLPRRARPCAQAACRRASDAGGRREGVEPPKEDAEPASSSERGHAG